MKDGSGGNDDDDVPRQFCAKEISHTLYDAFSKNNS